MTNLRFIAIDPKRAHVDFVEAKDLSDVCGRVGLDRNKVDHGSLFKDQDTEESYNIVVGEDSLFKGEDGRYFSIGNMLFSGGAVIYAADYKGDTVSIQAKPPVMFYRDVSEVETAIAAGAVERPVRAFDGVVTWRWPEARAIEFNEFEQQLEKEMVERAVSTSSPMRVDDTLIIMTDEEKK
jgi:hypothetical protein